MKKSKYAEKMVDIVEDYLVKQNVSPDFTIDDMLEDEDRFAIRLLHDLTGETFIYDLDSLYRQKQEEDVKVKDQFKDTIKDNLSIFVENHRNRTSPSTIYTYPSNEENYDEEYDEDDEYDEDGYDQEVDYNGDEDEEYEENIEKSSTNFNLLNLFDCIILPKEDFENRINQIEGKSLSYYIFKPIGNTNLVAILSNKTSKEYIVCESLLEKTNYYRVLDEIIERIQDNQNVIIETMEDIFPRPIYLILGSQNTLNCVFVRNENNILFHLNNRDIMEQVKEKIGTEDFYILLSSSNEFICIKKDNQKELSIIQDLIQQMNIDNLNSLSKTDRMYLYNFETNTLENYIEKTENSKESVEDDKEI